MISQLEKKITLRYLKPQRKEGFLKVISLFSFLGISLGVAVLIIVMSVMNGFRSELINKIVGFNAHAIIKPHSEQIDINKTEKLKTLTRNLFFSNNGEAVLIHKENTKGLLIRGYKKSDFKKLHFVKNENFRGNSESLTANNVSIGKDLSLVFNLSLGDKILLMSPKGVQTIIGNLPKQEIFLITCQ